ncbi:hypothetical protein RRG08_012789 [Elysia crispata]|uniref:DUF19 domain-containing protein n=1 Tax=Elysia crispata TaxID=231223 RepID=A0AAE0ZRU4_9GAST|nr:hypothetical protein RRG08_012789 [Elysia crispata]
MVWKLLLLLPCLVMLARASDECPSLVQCEQPIRSENIFADTDSMIFNIKDEQLLDRLCGKLPALKSCYSTNIVTCTNKNVKIDSRHFRDIIDYICTPAGRKVALATAKTTCTIDPDLNNWFLGMMWGCETQFIFDLLDEEIKKGRALTDAESCVVKSQFDTCINSSMNSRCGPEMAALIEKMWEIWTPIYYPEYVCGLGKTAIRRSSGSSSLTERSGWSKLQDYWRVSRVLDNKNTEDEEDATK